MNLSVLESSIFMTYDVASLYSFYSMPQVSTVNGLANAGVNKTQSPAPTTAATSSTSTQKGKDYDFSSLTQGMFAKQ